MHKFYIVLATVLLTAISFAQAPEKMSYQALVRDSGDNLVASQAVGMQISFLQGSTTGTVVYIESQTPTTNINGLVSIQIGGGTGWDTIDWSAGPYFIKTETDPTGGTGYTITGTSQLLSVPYALHAKTAENVPVGTTAGQMQYWNGTAWVVVPVTINEGAALKMISGVPTWTGGTPPATVPDAPTIGTASAGNEYATVTYIAPANNGGSVITGYTATSSPGGFIGTGTTSPITVTGLTNGVAYTFTVTATNTIGTSEASAASNSVTPSDATVPTVISATGRVWMDRNLGATQMATSSTDAVSYGDLYQWGRASDGHQIRTSAITNTVSGTDSPGHGDFIVSNTPSLDWRDPQNDNLWQAAPDVNNPCPSGYRIPTSAEWEAERLSWSSLNATGAFNSPLKLPVAGLRNGFFSVGELADVGSGGAYWSSTAVGALSSGIYFTDSGSGGANMEDWNRSAGFSVRCIQSTPPTVPDAPTIGTASAGNEYATVTYIAPANNGGSVITGYTATSSPGGFIGTGTTSPITVTGLTNGVAYTFTVTATNAIGTSEASAASNSVTPSDPTVPDAPTIGTASAGNEQAEVTYIAPANNGGSVITGYTATSSPGGFIGTGTTSPITVTGLTNGVAYTFTVTATNAIGTSEASAASNSVTPETVPTVISVTGRVWMDRNLGASEVATAYNLAASSGDLYQWGRASDGHQIKTSATTTTLSGTDSPGNANFIVTSSSPNDWRSPQNDNLWQGVNGINNPCPSGFRLPTEAEWDAERASWSANNVTGALASPLKLPPAYARNIDGSIGNGWYGYYWSSTVNGTDSKNLFFGENISWISIYPRASGNSVRCIQD